MKNECDLRQDKQDRIICIKCNKIYGKVGEIDINTLSTSCSKPSILQMSKNLATSTIKHVSTGMAQAEKKEREKRLEICVSCDRYNAEDKTCLECGCYLEIKTKWASEACPIGLWGSTLSRKRPCGGCKKRKNKT
jgi:hypothetical protein